MRYRFTSRAAAVLAAAAVAAGTLAAGAGSADAAVTAGAGRTADGEPVSEHDSAGQAVAFCTTPVLCEPPAGIIGSYFSAEADAGPVSGSWNVEAAVNLDLPTRPAMVSNSVMFRATGLRPNKTFTIRDPWGTHRCTTDASGRLDAKNCFFERGGESGGPFRLGPVKSFLRSQFPTAGFLGADAPQRVTGSPTGFNKLTVTGPGVNVQTKLFTVTSQLAPNTPMSLLDTDAIRLGSRHSTKPVTKVIRYRSVGTAAAKPRLSKAGANPVAFTVSSNCASVAPGRQCAIKVSYRPVVGRDKSAVLVIDDNTLAKPRHVALTGVAPRR